MGAKASAARSTRLATTLTPCPCLPPSSPLTTHIAACVLAGFKVLSSVCSLVFPRHLLACVVPVPWFRVCIYLFWRRCAAGAGSLSLECVTVSLHGGEVVREVRCADRG